MSNSQKRLIIAVFGLLLLCLTGPWSYDAFGIIPISVQSLWVILLPVISGWFGVIAVALYVLLGLSGLPVFSDHSSGWLKLQGPSGGFLIGFILISAAVVFYLKRNPVQSDPLRCFILFAVSHLLLLMMGFLWMFVILEDALEVIGTLILVLSPGLVLKSFLGAALSKIIYDHLLIGPSDE